MTRTYADRIVYFLALAGILVVVHLNIMVGRGFDRGCFGFSEPTATVACEIVTSSDAGSMFGVSNAVWGLVFYLLMAGLAAITGLTGSARARTLRLLLAAAGFVYSVWLVYVQMTLIGSFCKLCLISAGLTTLIAVAAGYDRLILSRND